MSAQMDNLMQKDLGLALHHRDRGNELFGKNEFVAAAKSYTDAIRFAPSDDQIFGIALSNKAQCLIRLNKNVTEALKLLDLAEESTYPKEKMDKLQNNRNIAKKLLNTSPSMANHPYTNAPGQSEKIVVRATEESGRSVFARQDIAQGEAVLAMESPFCCSVFQESSATHCHGCLKSIVLASVVPCSSCCVAIYCSKACKDTTVDVHSHMCRKILSSLPDEVKLAIFTLLREEHSREVEFMGHLESHESDAPLEAIGEVSEAIERAFLLDPSLEPTLSKAKILKRSLQIHSNAYAVFQMEREDSEGGDKLQTQVQRRVGLAVYQHGSMFNHSCDPNAVVSYSNGSKLTITTLKPIAAGDQLCHSYGPLTTRDSFQKRQDILKEKFFFCCRCSACLSHSSSPSDNQFEGMLQLETEADTVLNRLETVSSPTQFRALVSSAEEIVSQIEDFGVAHSLAPKSIYLKAGELADKVAHRSPPGYAMLKDFKMSTQFCERSIELLSHVYPATSIEMGREHLKLASIYFEMLMQPQDTSSASFRAMKSRFGSVLVAAKEGLSLAGPDAYDDLDELDEMKQIVNTMP